MLPPEEMNGNGIDRISSLPDPILCHILSSLSTKEAVQTCILSKRWTRVWASVPVLKFGCHEFVPGLSRPGAAPIDVYGTKFTQFVKGILQNREPVSLDKFELSWNVSCSSLFKLEVIGELIQYALKFQPRVFFANVTCWDAGTEVESIFTCVSLQDVYLVLDTELCYRPKSIVLPCLKKLEVRSLVFCHNDMDMLFLGCPMLEELSMCFCILDMVGISSNMLKRLVLYDCIIWGKNRKLQISTHSLLYLEFIRCAICPEKVTLMNMPSLIDARVDHRFWSLCNNDVGTACDFLSCLSNATSLDLRLSKMLKIEGLASIYFNNLKSLRLRVLKEDGIFYFIPFFLRNSPRLQKLTLIKLDYSCSDYNEDSSSQEGSKHVLFQWENLERVQIIKKK